MKIIKDVDFDFWWEVAEKCSYATFFHSPLWHKLIEDTYEEKTSAPVGLITDSGVRAVLPLLQTSKSAFGFFKHYESSFAGCYGGVIADGALSQEETEVLYRSLLVSQTGNIHLTENPLLQYWNVELSVSYPDSVEKDFTHILELDTMEDIISNFSQGHRTSMRKGKKMGVKIKRATSIEDYKAYYGAYEDSLERWGDEAANAYPWRLFENGYRIEEKYPEHIQLWLATVEDQVVAGAWTFYWNSHIDWWHGAAYKDYFDHYPNNVLLPRIFKDGIEKGYDYFDFNPSGGHDGVANFKKRFGASKWPINRTVLSGKIFRFLKKFKQTYMIGV